MSIKVIMRAFLSALFLCLCVPSFAQDIGPAQYRTVTCLPGLDATAVLQSAITTSNVTPVMLIGPTPCGISSTLTVPDQGIIVGEDTDSYESYNATFSPTPPYPSSQARTIIYAMSAFPNSVGSAMMVFGNYTVMKGVTLMGPAVAGAFTPIASLNTNCINIAGARFSVFTDVYANGCNGAWFANNTPPAATEAPQLDHVRGSLSGYGFYGFNVFDPTITRSDFNGNLYGGFYASNVSAGVITSNTFENTNNTFTAGVGFELDNSYFTSVTGNKFENNAGPNMRLANNSSISVTGSNFHCPYDGTGGSGNCNNGGLAHVSFGGFNIAPQFAGNVYDETLNTTQYIYNVEAGGTITNGSFDEHPQPGTLGTYTSALSSQIAAFVPVIPGASACIPIAAPSGGIYASANLTGSAAGTGGASFTTSNATSPDCTQDASTFVEDTSNGVHQLYISNAPISHSFSSASATAGLSVKAAVGSRSVTLYAINTAFTHQSLVTIALPGCTVITAASTTYPTTTATSTQVIQPDGSCKIALTTASITDTGINVYIGLGQGATISYTGNGSSVRVWGASVTSP